MSAGLAGVVHDRQRADGDEHNRDEDNVWRGGSAASQQNSTLASAFRKQACCSSTDQGGGKRRAVIAAFKNCARPSKSRNGFDGPIQYPPSPRWR